MTSASRPSSTRTPTVLVAVLGALVAIVVIVLVVTAASDFGRSRPDCRPARPHAAGRSEATVVVAGTEREYLQYLPSSYSGEKALPLIVSLHGIGGRSLDALRGTGLEAKAEAEGIIIVAPQGAGEPARWNNALFPPESGEADDLAFIDTVLDRVEAELCVNTARIYAAGMSNGAGMAVRLACNLSSRIAAIAAVAGAYFPPGSLELPDEPRCETVRPVPIVAFHGTEDETIPFEGGVAVLGITLRPIEGEVIPAWASHNGCTPDPKREGVAEHVRLVRYEDCADGAEVLLYVTEGAGHQWPGAIDRFPPDVADEISAKDLIWRFFSAHPLPTAD